MITSNTKSSSLPTLTQSPPLFLTIAALFVAMAVILPFVYLIIRAGTAGYVKVITIIFHTRTYAIFLNSLKLAIAVTVASVIIGVALAWLTTRTDLPGRKIWTVVTTLPLAIPSYVGAFTLISALGPKGMVQGWLEPLGVERLPSIYGFWGALLALTIFTYPYVLLSVRAALHGLDPTLEEAARSMGRSPWQVFYDVTLPHLRPSIIAGALLVIFYTLSDFGAVSMLHFNTFTRSIYLQYSSSFDRSAAAVLALLLVVLTLVILTFEAKMRSKARYYRSSSGTIRPATRLKLGKWKLPALAFCTLITTFGLIMPLAVNGFWLARGWMVGEQLHLGFDIIFNSITTSGLAAVAAVLAALPVTILAVRFPSWGSRWIERSAYIGYAMPGIVVALSLVFFGANYATFLYQTSIMLIFAYVVRFLPQATGSTHASLLQISPRLEEVARSLGRSQFQVLTSITVPLLKPGILTGLAMVFLTAMKELPATLLLSPTNFSALSTRIWGATEEAFFARASAPALILIMISAAAVWIIFAQEEKYQKT